MELKALHEYAAKEGIRLFDLKFTDLVSMWQHFTQPMAQLDEHAIEYGIGFDGSSIRGFQAINESDMVLIPDLSTAVKDPFSKDTVSIICDINDPISKQRYSRDPRYVAEKAEKYLKESGIGDAAYFGPEAEFFVFDDVRYRVGSHESFYFVDSAEGAWNTGRVEEGGNLGYKPRHKEGYFPVAPTDSLQELRNEMVETLMKSGIDVECHHHEVSTAGQCEIDMRYNTLVRTADNVMMYKYIVRNVARKHGKTVTFMPKPLFGDNGSGMHVHQSIWKGGKNLFSGNEYAGLSKLALYYIGGILAHAPALAAICSPTTNSYKRLVPGFEAPVNLVYSKRNRSAAIRIPMYADSPKSKRIEYRSPDPSCNPYLALSALLMAGLDGIKRKIEPGAPTDTNLYELPAKETANIKSLPTSLPSALAALEADHGFLLEGGVFTDDLIETWVDYKREKEEALVRLRPHPYEYYLYFDV